MSAHSNGATYISADVTHWSTQQRTELLEKIDALNQSATGTLTLPPPSGVQTHPAIPDEIESAGWTYPAYEEAMIALLSKHYVQAAAIGAAIKKGTGYVTRDEVYALGKYPETRSLKGFTRPVNRVTADLVDSGKLPEDAEDLLRPDYDPAVKSYQRAKGFFVPMEVVKLAHEQAAKAAATT